jgi:hypothetical protein
MTVALLVIGNGRLDYLHDTVEAALTHLPEMDHYLMIDDSGEASVQRELERNYPDFTTRYHDRNYGMARAVQSGFEAVLATDADYVFWLEEDMVILEPPPVRTAIGILQAYPVLAQMLFQRQCLTPDEHEGGSVAAGLHATRFCDSAKWSWQNTLFSLNPCLIPRNVLELGWDEDNEAGMTKKLLAHGFTFGVWDGQYVEHVGVRRGKKWQL